MLYNFGKRIQRNKEINKVKLIECKDKSKICS